jgi:hypothetical protein
MKRFHAATRGLPLALCLALAACGGDDGTDTDGDGTNTDGGTPGGSPDAGGGGGGNTSLPLDTSGASCNQYTKGSGALADLSYDTLNSRASVSNTTLSLEFTLANIGAAAAAPFKVVIYLYPDSANPCRGYPVMTYNYNNGAPPNTQGTIRYSQDLAQLAPEARPPAGTYRVGFVLDNGNAVTESDENNNRNMFSVQVKL